ncbi:MAG TPA: transporter substrate-binding domain-containing protein, partial [Bordetella sp.]
LYDSSADMLRDANAGRVNAIVIDYPIAAYGIAQGTFPKLHMVKSFKPTLPGEIGIATRKGDAELLGKISKGLANIKANGKLDAIIKKWGLAD